MAAGVAGYYVLATRTLAALGSRSSAGLALAAVVVRLLGLRRASSASSCDVARVELRKIVWPTREETLQTTLVVFVLRDRGGLFFWVLDLVLAWATEFLTGQGS